MEILEYSQAWSQGSQEKTVEGLGSTDRIKWAEEERKLWHQNGCWNNPYDLEGIDDVDLDRFVDWRGGEGLEAVDGLEM